MLNLQKFDTCNEKGCHRQQVLHLLWTRVLLASCSPVGVGLSKPPLQTPGCWDLECVARQDAATKHHCKQSQA